METKPKGFLPSPPGGKKVFKDKLRPIQNFKFFQEKNYLKLAGTKPQVARKTPPRPPPDLTEILSQRKGKSEVGFC